MHTVWSANRPSPFARVIGTRAQTLIFWRPVFLETLSHAPFFALWRFMDCVRR